MKIPALLPNLIDKITAFYDRFREKNGDAQDFPVIESWIEQAKRLLLLDDLSNHDAVKYITEAFQAEIETINQRLLQSDSTNLPDSERDRLLDKRDLANTYLNLFVPVKSEIAKLEESVDNELRNL